MAYSNVTVELIGHLGNDPRIVENRNDPTMKFTEFALATNLRNPKSDSTVWWNCSIIDPKTSDFVMNYLKKGRLVYVVGELRDASVYTDKRDNSNKVSMRVKVYNITALDAPRSNDSNNGNGNKIDYNNKLGSKLEEVKV